MRSVVVLVGVIIFTGAASAQEPCPTLADVNATIDRGLAFLARDALAWKKEHNGVSCHHASTAGSRAIQ